MFKKNTRFGLLVFLLVFFMSGCGGGDESSPDNSDSDGDGLTNIEELQVFGTSPELKDTDGDSFDDYIEAVVYFDETVNPYKFNPLIADVPKIGIRLEGPHNIKLHLTDTTGTSRSFETKRSQETVEGMSSSFSHSNTLSLESTHTAKVEAGFPWSFGASYETSLSIGLETSTTSTNGMTRENRATLAEAEAFEETSTMSASGGEILALIEVENKGNMSYKIETLILSASEPDPLNPGVFRPIGTLTLNGSDFPDITVAPRETLSHLNFVNDSLDLETTRKLLRDSSSLLISPSAYELTDATGTAFAFNFTDINAKTALVIIDYASYANPASYLVATNSDPDSRGIAVGKVFRDILQIPFEAGVTLWEGTERNGLLSLRDNPDTTVDETKMGYWLVVHIRDNGIQEISTWFDLLKEDYDFEAIELRAGDALHLVYIEDKDKDGIYSREEFMRGASDEEGDLDSDNDGINDYTELQNGTNLGNKDTDGDGLIDFYDTNPLSFDYFSVDSSWSHAVLIKTDGSLWAWGSNQFGQLALPADTSWSGTPVEIGGTGWKMAAAGYDHSGAIKENGELWMWGANHDGQLGLGLSDVDAVYSPTQMGSDADWRFISFGGNMSHAYKDSGDHWAWGANVNDILGITTESGLNLPDTVTVPMRSNDVDRWQSIEAGENFGIGVKTNGELWSWGRNISGQLCQGYDSDWELIPGQVGDQSNWAAVSSGSGFTLLIDTSGTLWACGSNSHGQLGNPDISAVNAPLAISTGWKQVSAGYYHAVGIKDDGSLWNWGGEHGSNGLQTRVGTDNDWIAVSAQLRASYAIKEDGTVWLMGDDGTLFPPSCMTSVIPEGSCQ